MMWPRRVPPHPTETDITHTIIWAGGGAEGRGAGEGREGRGPAGGRGGEEAANQYNDRWVCPPPPFGCLCVYINNTLKHFFLQTTDDRDDGGKGHRRR